MLITFIRTLILYFLVILSIRLMGKRQVGELQPYELVITLMISDLASLPMQDTRLPLLLGVIPIVTLLFLKMLLSEFQQRSPLFERVLDGSPSIIISHGKLNLSIMKKQRLTINDILEELRSAGYLDINDIQYAVIETNGTISVIPKNHCDTIKREDLNIFNPEVRLPVVIYIDGHLNKRALNTLKLNEEWLEKKLKHLNAPPKEELYLVMLDSENNLFIQEKCNDSIKDTLL